MKELAAIANTLLDIIIWFWLIIASGMMMIICAGVTVWRDR